MIKPREAVRTHRAQLVERAQREREELARQLGTWSGPLRTVERGFAVYRGVRRSMPVIGLGAGIGMAALAFLRPAGIGGWVQKATEIWNLLSGIRNRRAERVAERTGEPVAPVPSTPAATE